MPTDTLRVRVDDPIGCIAPDIYGHFAEHLGRCIYDGLWVGEDAAVEHRDGLRAATLDLLADLNPPVLRWPGGCFADDYHWEDGVDEERPRRRNLWWTQGPENVPEEPNAFGTDEFVRACEAVGAEPYIAANVGTGTPDEATNWVEYCNYDGDTEYADRRRENGSEAPHGVTYWGVGNENWGCGGDFEPDAYAREYRRFANYLRSFGRVMGDPLELIACGHTTEDWNRRFLEALGDASLVDHLSVHRYYHAGDGTDFDDEEYYELFARAAQVADDVDRAAATVDAFAPGAEVGIILDEWGVWHPEAVADNGLEQPNTVRDALSAAGVLDLLNERADVVTMANLAQTVNVLQCVVETDAEAAWPTPTYRVFDLYRPHMGATAVRTAVDTDARTVGDGEVALLSASASVDDDEVYVTATNRDLGDARRVEIDLGTEPSEAEASALFAEHEPAERSTKDNADAFAPAGGDVAIESGGTVVVDVPASAAVGVTIRT